jgi:hypothetical protein
MTKTTKFLIQILLLVSVLTLSGCSLSGITKNAATEKTENQALSAINVTLIINNGTSTDQFDEKIKTETSVLELMKILSDANKIEFKYQDSGAGAFIVAINGIQNDSAKNWYWLLYLNGKMAETGASDLKLKDGDRAEWRYMDASNLF